MEYPIDPAHCAPPAEPWEPPVPGRDRRAPKDPSSSTCPGCKYYRARDDWEHSREIGQCSYPYDQYRIPDCIACQKRLPRDNVEHTLRHDECDMAKLNLRVTGGRKSKSRRSDMPHEVEPPPDREMSAGLPMKNIQGEPLGADAEEAVRQERERVNCARTPTCKRPWG